MITLNPVVKASASDIREMENLVNQWNADYSGQEPGEGIASVSYHLVKWYGYSMVCCHAGDCLENSYTWNTQFQRCSGCRTIQINMDGEICEGCGKNHR